MNNAAPATTPQLPAQLPGSMGPTIWPGGSVNPSDISNPEARRWSDSPVSKPNGEDFNAPHVSHPICKF